MRRMATARFGPLISKFSTTPLSMTSPVGALMVGAETHSVLIFASENPTSTSKRIFAATLCLKWTPKARSTRITATSAKATGGGSRGRAK